MLQNNDQAGYVAFNMEEKLQSPLFVIPVLLLSVALLNLGNDLQGTLLGVRAAIEGLPRENIGFIMSAYFAGFVAGPWFIPRLISQVGHIRTFAALASLASGVALAHVLIINTPAWMLLRFVHGICYSGMMLVVESWLNGSSSEYYRGRVLSIYSIVFYLSSAAGHPLLNIAPPEGFMLFCIVSILISLAVIPITVARVENPGRVPVMRMRVRSLFKTAPMGVAGIFIAGFCMNAFRGMGPTFGQDVGLDSAGISAIMAVTTVGGLALQWPMGLLSDRIDRRKVILWASLGAGVVAIVIGFSGSIPINLLLSGLFIFGGLGIPVYAVCIAHANDHVQPGEFVATASTMLFMFGLGSACGPIAAGYFMSKIGPGGLFMFTGYIWVLFFVFGLFVVERRKPQEGLEKETFIAVPRTTPSSLLWYARRARAERKIREGKARSESE